MKKQPPYKAIMLNIVATIVSLSFYACNDNVITVPEDIVFPDSGVSYVYHVQPLMKYTCASGGCHTAFDRKAGIALDTYFDLTTAYAGAMCIPGNPDGSVLIQMLENKLPHSYIVDFRINKNQIQGMRTWIKEGLRMN